MAVAGSRLNAPEPAELLAALPAALILLDPEGAVRDANVAAESLLNQSLSAIRGRPLAEILLLPIDYVSRSGRDSAFALYDLPMMTTRGTRFRADFVVTPMPERPDWSLLTLHHGAAAQLTRFDRGSGPAAIGAAAMLAHEIKNPLSGIRGAAQLIGAEAQGEAKALTALIRDEVDRIAALIDRMESFTDTRPLALEAQNIYSTLDHVCGLARQGICEKVTILEDYDPSLPSILGNRDALAQVLLNLLKNAAEATGEGGTIHLTTAFRPGVSVNAEGGARKLPIEVCVIDDGPGAPPGIADHLFDPFVSSKPSGTGLGLSLVAKIVGDHGGVVEFENLERGAAFRVRLPAYRGGEQPAT